MPDPVELIDRCARLGIRVAVDGGRLVIDAPRGALTPELTDALRATKPALIEELTARASDGPVEPPPGFLPPASFGQERLWVLDRWAPGATTWINTSVKVLETSVDDQRLEQAVRLVAERHPVLRTRLQEVDGRLVQVVQEAASVEVLHQPLPDVAGAMEVERAYANQPITLDRDLPFRVAIRRLPDQVRVQGIFHHAGFDGWSGDVFRAEVARCYVALSEGVAPAPTTSASYAAWAAWQRRRQATPHAAAALAWWKRTLAGLAPIDLPAIRPRPAQLDEHGATWHERWDAETAAMLEQTARRLGASSFMVVAAALAGWCARLSGQTDVGIGMPVAGRNHPSLAGTMGYLVNLVVLRIDCSGNPTFAELVIRARRAVAEALEHADTPFDRVVEALAVPRDPSRTPLFSVLIDWQRPPRRQALPGWPERSEAVVDTGAVPYDLALHVREGDGLSLDWEHRHVLADRAGIERLSQRLQVLLRAGLADPQRTLNTLPLLGPADESFLAAVNHTEHKVPAVTVHQLITDAAARFATVIAVECGSERRTYRQVVERAQALAGALVARGVGKGALVGLCLARTADLPATMLGVLIAGAAYVPLDPAFPRARLAMMIEDAKPVLILSDGESASSLPDGTTWIDPRQLEGVPLAHSPATSDDRCYVLFTSGSTGRPKGVELEHRNMVNFMLGMVAAIPPLAASARVLAITTLSFDIHVTELLLPLTVGGTVVVATRAQATDPTAIVTLARFHHITVLQATPATWTMMSEVGAIDAVDAVRICGGESLPPALATRLIAGGRYLYNVYGPTETAVWSTSGLVSADATTVDVGRPLANTVIDIMDADGQLVPPGVEGEVCIGGAGVARGYLGLAELTAERFRADPARSGQRIYRTGDRGRWTADGRLLIAGRMDQQIKLRGFRIELGEIEAALAGLPEVAQAAVVLHPEGGGTLAAFVVASGSMTPALAELKTALRERLPAYMLPGSLTWLATLPMTPNGKVDRKALLTMATAPPPRAMVTPPRTDTESKIAAAFSAVLTLPTVGREDSFFDLGGHSLAAVRLIDRLGREGVRLSPGDLVSQNVAQLAALVDRPLAIGARS